MDKGTQEIYGLINYGEIWKKFGSKFDNKLGHHLQELVHYGFVKFILKLFVILIFNFYSHTICKMKGKSIRIKTPICKALKKLHNLGGELLIKNYIKQIF